MQPDDVARVAEGLSEAEKMCLAYHANPKRGASCGSMATDMAMIFAGLLDFAKDSRLELTKDGLAVRAYLEKQG